MIAELSDQTQLQYFGFRDDGSVQVLEIGDTAETVADEPYWSPSVEGDTIGIQIILPSLDSLKSLKILPLKIAHRFATVSPQSHLDCSNHVDVACSTGTVDTYNTIAKITYEDATGSYVCSGTLMNDESPGFIPYFLTANHCLAEQSSADTTEFIFFHQFATCGETALDARRFITGGGAVLLATSAAQDSTFLKISEELHGPNWFAGWSIDDELTEFGTELISYSHPGGHEKKYAKGNSQGLSDVQVCDDGEDCNTVEDAIHVTWSEGVIEVGSSGSGIFSNEYLVGVLSGGDDSCEAGSASYGNFRNFFPLISDWLESNDDHHDIVDYATEVEVGSTTTGSIDDVSDVDMFKVEFTGSGTLTVYTTGTTDTQGELFNDDFHLYDDDSGDDTNFRIAAEVDSGTYYVQVTGKIGDYELHVEFSTSDVGDVWRDSHRMLLNSSFMSRIDTVGDVDWYTFQTDSDGVLTIYSTGSTNTKGSLISTRDSGRDDVDDDDSGDDSNFRIVDEVPKEVYYVTVSASNDEDLGDYTLHVEFVRNDDHGDTSAEATEITVDSTISGRIGADDDVDMFTVQTTASGTLTVFTTGATDTAGELSGNGSTWTDDDSGNSLNFWISTDLDAGDYLVKVDGAQGIYELHVEFVEDDRSESPQDAVSVGLNTLISGSIGIEGDVDWYQLQIDEVGLLTIYTVGNTDTFGVLRPSRRGRALRFDDDSGDRTNFRIVERVFPGIYYISVRGYDEFVIGGYTLHIEFTPIDDHGDSILGSTIVASTAREWTYETTGVLDQDDEDFFNIQIPEDVSISIYTTGDIDTVGRLEDGDGLLVQENDDENEANNTNFHISTDMASGVYNLKVSGYKPSTTGEYALHIEVSQPEETIEEE